MTFYVIARNSEDAEWHVTLLPAFEIDEDALYNFTGLAKDLLRGTGVIQTHGVAEENFTGAFSEIVPALRLERTRSLVEIHEILIGVLIGLQGKFRTPEFTGSGFTPHVTGAKLDSAIPEFDTVAITRYTIEGFSEVDSFSLKSLA